MDQNQGLFNRQNRKNIITISDRAKYTNTTSYSFLRVFQIQEIRAIMVYMVVVVFGVCLLFNGVNEVNKRKVQIPFLLGGLFGFFSIGICSDLLLKGKYIYTCIVLLHAVVLILVISNLICLATSDNNLFDFTGLTFYIIYGYICSFGWILIFVVLPLYVTAKEREKHSFFEIPMAAQIFSMLNSMQILLGMFVSSIFNLLPVNDPLFSQVIPCLFFMAALIPLLPRVKKEWH